MSPVLFDVWDGTAWRPYGGASNPVDPDRTLLVRGAYEPSAEQVGPLPSVSSFTQVDGSSAGGVNLVQANTTYEDCEFWGGVSFRAPGIKTKNCIFRGPQPGLTAKAVIKNYGTGYYHGIMEHCLIDPYAWYTERGFPMMTAATYINRFGIHGGDIEMRWCHVRNVEDGVNWVQGDDQADDTGNLGFNSGTGWVVPAGQRFMIVDRCLFEAGTYVAGPDYNAAMGGTGQSGGHPHNDAFQVNYGRNLWITGSLFGGYRDMDTYREWPADPSFPPAALDWSNALLMIQQEGATYATSNPRYVQNVLIEDMFLRGGAASINMNYKYGNPLDGVTLRRIKIGQRQAGWGQFMDDGVLSNTNGGKGYYLAKGTTPSALTSTWENITVLETGTAIPFTNN